MGCVLRVHRINQILTFFISYCVENDVYWTGLCRESIVSFSPMFVIILISVSTAHRNLLC